MDNTINQLDLTYIIYILYIVCVDMYIYTHIKHCPTTAEYMHTHSSQVYMEHCPGWTIC